MSTPADAASASRSTRGRLESPPAARLGTALFYLIVALALYDGWRNRGDHLLSAESGIGYALGVVGGSMMLLMLLYSVRKRVRWLHGLGRIKHWFRGHMVLGVLAPTLILYHANFQLGSLNSRVALFCMLLVAGSGLVGRYLYSRIHYGLYGQRTNAAQLAQDLDRLRAALLEQAPFAEPLTRRLEALQTSLGATPQGTLQAAWFHLRVGSRCRCAARALVRAFAELVERECAAGRLDAAAARRLKRSGSELVRTHTSLIRRSAQLTFYERMFSLWHVLHVPLFLMLLVTGIAHVVAVHMY